MNTAEEVLRRMRDLIAFARAWDGLPSRPKAAIKPPPYEEFAESYMRPRRRHLLRRSWRWLWRRFRG